MCWCIVVQTCWSPTVKLMDFGLAVFYAFSAEKKPQERKKKGGATVAQVSYGR